MKSPGKAHRSRITGVPDVVHELVKRRVVLGLDQAAIAQQLGVSQAAVGTWESGDRRMTIDRIIAYGRVVGLELGWNPPPPPPPEREKAAAFLTLARHLGLEARVTDAAARNRPPRSSHSGSGNSPPAASTASP